MKLLIVIFLLCITLKNSVEYFPMSKGVKYCGTYKVYSPLRVWVRTAKDRSNTIEYGGDIYGNDEVATEKILFIDIPLKTKTIEVNL